MLVCQSLNKDEMNDFRTELVDLFCNYDICSGCVITEANMANVVIGFITEFH